MSFVNTCDKWPLSPGAADWSGTAGPLGELSSTGTCIASKVVLENDPTGAALGVSWKRPLPYNVLNWRILTMEYLGGREENCVGVVHLTFLLQLVWKVIFVN